MHELYLQYIRSHTNWLSCVIFEYKWFYYDLWSLVHIWSGAMIFVLLTANKYKKRWLKLLLLVSLFEVYEATIAIGIFRIFAPEKSIDVVNDIVNGMLGGYLMYIFFKWNDKRIFKVWFAAFLSSFSMAYIWVGSHGYNYNIPFFNSQCINWWALICWTLAGTGISLLFNTLKDKMNQFNSLITTWLIYLVLLIIIESIAYFIFPIKEISKGTTPLVFNIIQGNSELHVFYTIVPIYFTTVFIVFLSLFNKYEKAQGI